MPIYAGTLRHRITIERPVKIQDPETGDVTITWEPLYSRVPAAVNFLSAKEFVASQAVQSQIVARVTIRFLPNLTADMRIIHGHTVYNPAAWLPDNDSGLEYLTAPVSTGVNDG